MVRPLPTAAAAGVLLLSGLAGCTSNPDPGPSGSPSVSVSQPSVPVSPSPTWTLPPDEQEAFAEATDVVMAFAQTWVDLYTGARTDLNDLNDVVAAGDLLDASLKRVSQDLSQGVKSTPLGAQVVLVSAEPGRVTLDSDPPSVVLEACIDSTSVTTSFPDGSHEEGVREKATYTVIQTSYLPAPGWAVEKMVGPADPEQRRC